MQQAVPRAQPSRDATLFDISLDPGQKMWVCR